jgi:predicted DNA-binding helix-hairpin-helix protein
VDLRERLDILATGARFDLSCAGCGQASRARGELGQWIYPAALPSGRRMPLLKLLLTNVCERNCLYCAQRAGRDFRRLSFSPEEVAQTFVQMRRAGQVNGLFLSSGIAGGSVRTMDRMLATAELLRQRHGFRGYLHLKILPGAEPAQIERAVALATRVSINLEAPSASHLAAIGPSKRFREEIVSAMGQIAGLLHERAAACRPAARGRRRGSSDPGVLDPEGPPEPGALGQTTQMVVGAGDERDREIVLAASRLYGCFGLRRVYYAGFQPVPGTPLEGRPAAAFLREHRLYQADFLLRQYGFAADEIPFAPDGNLETGVDPKTGWAERHPERFPLEVNRAGRAELLRVPGLGPGAVGRLLVARRHGRISDERTLRRLGIPVERAARYLLIAGRQPAAARFQAQLSLPLGR